MPEMKVGITTRIGCSVNCRKYCPQEIIVKEYVGPYELSLEGFKKLISTVPPSVAIEFAGCCEPFLNPKCVDMILYAHEKGHHIDVYSTLVGLRPEDLDRILHIPFRNWVLHLPDSERIAHIPMTKEYFKNLEMVLRGVKNISFMSMSNLVSSGHEDLARGTAVKKKGDVGCHLLFEPAPQLLPSGAVYLCCYDHAFEERMGNMYIESYQDILKQYQIIRRRLETDPNSMCHRCKASGPYWIRKAVFSSIAIRERFKENNLFKEFLLIIDSSIVSVKK